jgi:hypothetical protein
MCDDRLRFGHSMELSFSGFGETSSRCGVRKKRRERRERYIYVGDGAKTVHVSRQLMGTTQNRVLDVFGTVCNTPDFIGSLVCRANAW